jgi:hypothetical protein
VIFSSLVLSLHKNRKIISLTPVPFAVHYFGIIMLFFYLLFLLCIAGLATSAPLTYHRHHLVDSPFPYGKLTDRLLNVNDVSYMLDDLDEDMVRIYPENHSTSFSSAAIPIASLELPLPNVRVYAKNLFSFAYRIPDIIKKAVIQEWDTTALVRWRTMARDQS